MKNIKILIIILCITFVFLMSTLVLVFSFPVKYCNDIDSVENKEEQFYIMETYKWKNGNWIIRKDSSSNNIIYISNLFRNNFEKNLSVYLLGSRNTHLVKNRFLISGRLLGTGETYKNNNICDVEIYTWDICKPINREIIFDEFLKDYCLVPIDYMKLPKKEKWEEYYPYG